MDFFQLEKIVKVAEIGNVTKAAEALFMTQPALSHFLAKVEKEEGVMLFDRSSNPLTLTYAGECYVKTAKQILTLNKQYREEMLAVAKNKKGRIVIGIPQVRAAYMLPRFLPKYHEQFPNIQIRTIEHGTNHLKEDVRLGNVDFAIFPAMSTHEVEEFQSYELFEEKLVLVCKTGYIPDEAVISCEGDLQTVDLRKLKDLNYILLEQGRGIRNALDTLFRFHGYKPKIFMETTNNEIAFNLASAGMGLAVVPYHIIDTFIPFAPIDVYDISPSPLTWTLYAVFRYDEEVGYLAKACLNIIKECFAVKEK